MLVSFIRRGDTPAGLSSWVDLAIELGAGPSSWVGMSLELGNLGPLWYVRRYISQSIYLSRSVG